MIAEWPKSTDVAQQKVGISQLTALSDEALEQVLREKAVGEKVQIALIEELAARQGEKMVPAMLEAASSGDPARVQMALRFLASIGDPRSIPVFIKALNSDDANRRIAADALAQRPKEVVGPALLKALDQRGEIRDQVVSVLSKLQYYEAIDPLTKLARTRDPAVYETAVEGLRAICDPDQPDLTRMSRSVSGRSGRRTTGSCRTGDRLHLPEEPQGGGSGDDSPGTCRASRREGSGRLSGKGSSFARTSGDGRCLPEDPVFPEVFGPGTLRRSRASALELAHGRARRRDVGLGHQVGVAKPIALRRCERISAS